MSPAPKRAKGLMCFFEKMTCGKHGALSLSFLKEWCNPTD